MNVVVVAPHPDDETIGCGGAICRHVERGDTVAAIFLTSGELGLEELPEAEARRIREAEAEAAASVLGVGATCFLRQPDWFLGDRLDDVARLLSHEVERMSPELLYLPHPAEDHPDHRAASHAGQALAAVAEGGVPLRLYEVWTPLTNYDDVEDISAVMARKLAALRCYASQLSKFRYDRAVEGLNQYRGALAAHVDYAEVFASWAEN